MISGVSAGTGRKQPRMNRMSWAPRTRRSVRTQDQSNVNRSARDSESEAQDDLDARIDAYHDRIASLMHERNKYPEDKDIVTRLQNQFAELRALQKERADQMSAYFQARRIRPSEEDLEFFRKAREIRERYESASAGDVAAQSPVHSKP